MRLAALTFHSVIKCAGCKRVLRLLLLGLPFLLCAPLYSQNLGRISGNVNDSGGGVVVGATVTVTDVERGITRTLTTDTAGAYSAPNLIPSTYSVRGAFTGFKAMERQGISVGVGQDVHIDLTLQPGEQTQAVTVTADVPTITTTNAQLGGTISGNTLSDLPIAGHNFLQALTYNPGMLTRPGSGAGPQQWSNGLRSEFNVYVFDGVTDQMTYYTQQPIAVGYPAAAPEQAVILPPDAVQEFNIVENPKAEYGWRPGAQISVGMKSGTNTIHGSAFAIGRDTALMTRNPFFPIKTPTQFEDYGATIGGPIKQDKLFYLLSYEGQNEVIGNPTNTIVPTTISLATAGNPLGSPTNSLPDAINGLIQNHVINPAAVTSGQQLSLNLAGCVVTPAVKCTPNAGLFSNNLPTTQLPIDYLLTGGTNNGVAKFDYHLNDHNSLNAEIFTGRGFVTDAISSVTQPYWSTPLGVNSDVARAVWTWVPNSSWVNDARFGFDHSLMAVYNAYDCNPASNAPNYANLGFVTGANMCGFPAVTITGFNNNNPVLAGESGSSARSGIYRWLDSVSYTHGNHIFKFGGEISFDRGLVGLNLNKSAGTLSFTTTSTAALNAFTGSTVLENFLDGLPTSGTMQVGTVPRNFTYKSYAGYAQDDWRILPQLTLNLGLRYEFTTTINEANGLFGDFSPASASGMVQQGNSPLYKLDPWAIGPRIGLAWDVTGKSTTVVRAGFNIMYQNPVTQIFFTPGSQIQTMPTGLTMGAGCTTTLATCTRTATTPGGTINLASYAITPPTSPLPWALNTPIFSNYLNASASCTNVTTCSIGGVAQHLEYPMVLNWNFGIQRALTRNLTLDVNYVGNHGQHLFAYSDLNAPTPGTNAPAQEQLRRPFSANGLGQFPWFQKVLWLGSFGAVSNYNALQAVLTARAAHGLSFNAGYTYSHSLDDGSVETNMVVPQNNLNPFAEYGNSLDDLRHRFTFTPVYQIPGKKAFAQMLEGWELASAFTISSGRPYNVIDAGDDLSGTGEGQDRWTLVGNAQDLWGFGGATPIPCYSAAAGKFAGSGCTVGLPQACVNAAAAEQVGPQGQTGTASLNSIGCYMVGNSVMVPPAQGTFGTMSRYALYGKGFSEWDLSIIKGWKLTERLSTQFRAEIYNVINSTEYNAPQTSLNSPSSLGESLATPDVGNNSPVIGTGGPRKIQLGLKFLF